MPQKSRMGLSSAILVLSAAVSTLGGLIFGYELGIISGALLQLKIDYYLSCFEQEALVSGVLIGALLASLVGGVVIDRYGRRSSILVSNLVVFAGSLILVYANSFWWLVVGRIIIGFAISISSMACCIYVSEIVQPYQRGMLVSLYETGITAGILLSYAMNYVLANVNQGWKYMFGLAIAPAIAQFIIILFLPLNMPKQSAQNSETENGFIQLQNIDESEGVLDPNERRYTFLDLFSAKDNMRTRTIIGLGLVLFQQLTGQPNVLYYASTIFRSAGFQSNSSAVLASVGLGVVKVVSTLVAMSCADKAGRRILLIVGCIVMAISVTGIGLASFSIKLDTPRGCELVARLNTSVDLSNSAGMFDSLNYVTGPKATAYTQQVHQSISMTREVSFTSSGISNTTTLISGSSSTWDKETRKVTDSPVSSDLSLLNWIILLSMMAFVSAFSIGFGPMTWLVLSEIYPADIRGRAFAFCNSFNWAANLFITLTFLDVIESIGMSWTFLIYGLMGVAAVIFIYIFIPETKGQSLEEIDKQFSAKRLLKRSHLWERLQWCQFSGPKYQRMEISRASLSSASSSS
ncbi:solute carrier family 2, facilitated glucose transporter member 10 [Bombina bombina]|uniref:solute carrier family 2, facilitated glucose transporter member 10 n=1 Tax=Bombina bombina TaxID=8345 RepID=UPI00235ABF77|nr:solute carrier family 2, facilitated glucose transporter member 10 [Bombina bombina]